MKKAFIYSGAIILGVGAAVLLFPSDDSAPVGEVSVQPTKSERPRAKKLPKKSQSKPGAGAAAVEVASDVKPGAQDRADWDSSALNTHRNRASPAWVQMGRLLALAELPELSGEAREMVVIVSALKSADGVDVEELVGEERALLEKIAGQISTEEVTAQASFIEGLLAELEADGAD